MSVHLDAIAYRNRTDYRLKRIEHILNVVFMIKEELNVENKQLKLYHKYLNEINHESYTTITE